MVHHEILPTPNHPQGTGVWTFYGSAIIDAPASQVWSALLDFKSYHKWNLYNPTIDTPSGTNDIKPDDIISLAYRPEPVGKLMAVPCKVIHVDHENLSLCWLGQALSIPTMIFYPEKINRVIPINDHQCQCEIFETQSGPMAYIVKWTMGAKLSAMSQGMVDGLKKYVETNLKDSS